MFAYVSVQAVAFAGHLRCITYQIVFVGNNLDEIVQSVYNACKGAYFLKTTVWQTCSFELWQKYQVWLSETNPPLLTAPVMFLRKGFVVEQVDIIDDHVLLVNCVKLFMSTRHIEILVGEVDELDDLASHLLNDALHAATSKHLGNLPDPAAKKLLSDAVAHGHAETHNQVRKPDMPDFYDCWRVGVCFNVSAQQFEKRIAELLEYSPCACLHMVYCGHGRPDGSLVLQDGYYDPAQLRSVIESVPRRNAKGNNAALYFNSCYGLASQYRVCPQLDLLLNGITVLKSKLEELYDLVLDGKELDEKARRLNAAVFGPLLTSSSSSSVKVNTGGGSDGGSCAIIPLSLGRLPLKGCLHFFGEEADCPLEHGTEWQKACRGNNSWSYAKKVAGVMKMPARVNPPKCVAPTIQLFTSTNKNQGGGDSALLRIGKLSILVDGCARMLKENKHFVAPPFWNTVSALGSLDMVVLTHGDGDHADGLLALGSWLQSPVNRQQFTVRQALFTGEKAIAEARSAWSKPKALHKLLSDASINDVKYDMYQGQAVTLHDGDYHVRLSVLLPTESDSQMAQLSVAEAFLPRDLRHDYVPNESTYKQRCKLADYLESLKSNVTPINQLGTVVLVTAKHKKTKAVSRMLFTGDADGAAITMVLKVPTDNHFSYVDIPHHGADANGGDKFVNWFLVNKITVDYWGISTNGGGYGHPHKGVLDALKKYVAKFPKSKVILAKKELLCPKKGTRGDKQAYEWFSDNVIDGEKGPIELTK